jgi:hypothetical protein
MIEVSKKVRNQLHEIYKNKCRFVAISLIFLSLILFLTMLIGSAVGSVDLNKYTFDAPIREILQRNSIKFTLLGYCIDDKCTKDVSHNFDKGNLHLSYDYYIRCVIIFKGFFFN